VPALSAAPAAGATLLATLRGTEVRYISPGGPAAGLVPATWYGARSTVPVIATRPGWVRVRLARRPNGATAWLRAGDVVLSTTPYRIVIDLATAHLALYERGRAVFTAPAGLGTRSDPTPAGSFFVAFFEKPPGNEPGYGPFVIVTSAHSDVIGDWARSGDAVIGIHGPLGDGSEIGTTGAHISHGCIRLHVADLVRLRHVLPGSPVDIIR